MMGLPLRWKVMLMSLKLNAFGEMNTAARWRSNDFRVRTKDTNTKNENKTL